jgi:hypothetical protein
MLASGSAAVQQPYRRRNSLRHCGCGHPATTASSTSSRPCDAATRPRSTRLLDASSAASATGQGLPYLAGAEAELSEKLEQVRTKQCSSSSVPPCRSCLRHPRRSRPPRQSPSRSAWPSVLPPSLLHAVADESRERRLAHSEVLEFQRFAEPIEQALAGAEAASGASSQSPLAGAYADDLRSRQRPPPRTCPIGTLEAESRPSFNPATPCDEARAGYGVQQASDRLRTRSLAPIVTAEFAPIASFCVTSSVLQSGIVTPGRLVLEGSGWSDLTGLRAE